MAPAKAETRAAVMAALISGQGVCEVAKEYNIPKGTVSKWAKQARKLFTSSAPPKALAPRPEEGAPAPDPVDRTAAPRPLEEQVRFYLSDIFGAVTSLLEVTRDPAWVRKQPAQELAVFVGVISDKAFKVLEAAERADRERTIAEAAAGDRAAQAQ